jgi:hypothetical protein
VPLSNLQSEILRLLAAHRDPESYVGGSTPLNLNAPRFSGDIGFFHDREERVTQAAEQDSAILQEHGFSLKWLRRELSFYAALVELGGETTKLEWVLDSDFRFFPVQRDELFGMIQSGRLDEGVSDVFSDDKFIEFDSLAKLFVLWVGGGQRQQCAHGASPDRHLTAGGNASTQGLSCPAGSHQSQRQRHPGPMSAQL